MFKYTFPCYDEQETRRAFEEARIRDTSAVARSMFGFKLYRRGLYVQRVDEKIKGFYVSQSELEDGTRGSPPKVDFVGCFKNKREGTVFEVSIYPRPWEFVFLFVSLVVLAPVDDILATVLFAGGFFAFMVGYYYGIKKATEELKKFIR